MNNEDYADLYRNQEYCPDGCRKVLIAIIVFWIVVISLAILLLCSCSIPCKPCRSGYYLKGDSCYLKELPKPSKIY